MRDTRPSRAPLMASLFDREPAPPVPWGGFDLLVITGIYLLLQIAAASLVGNDPAPVILPAELLGYQTPAVGDAAGEAWSVATLREVGRTPRGVASAHLSMKLMAAGSAASLLAMFAAIVYLRLLRRATWSDLGLRSEDPLGDIRIGLTTFAVVAIPIFGLNVLVNTLLDPQQGHPIVEIVTRFPGFYWISLVTAVIIAPVTEEFFFRGVLLGWLDSLPTAREIDVRGRPQLAWWPVGLTSAGFALLHLGHGAAPVALFFFAMILGWLYQRHHRLLPCITLHAALNGTSMLLLGVQLLHRGA